MKTVGGLFDRLVDPDHLAAAARLTTRGKRRRPDVAWFLFRREAELARIRRVLAEDRWLPAPFELLRIYDPKPRLIAHTLIEERVIHAALALLLERAWADRLAPEDLACRSGGGTARARLALQRQMRQHRFCVHLDIRSYFPSVHLGILRAVLGRRIRDRRFLATLDPLLREGAGLIDRPGMRAFLRLPEDWPPRGRGLPIGAYTSQVLATHVLLCDLDHHVKRALKAPGYVRYVDDLFVFGDRRADLRAWRRAIGDWLRDERDLRLKHPEAPVLACAGTLTGLGARIDRAEIRPGRNALRRLRWRVLRARWGGRRWRASIAGSVAVDR